MLPREIEYSNIIEGPQSRKTRDLIFIQASKLNAMLIADNGTTKPGFERKRQQERKACYTEAASLMKCQT